MSQDKVYKATFEGQELTISYIKPNVGQLNEVFRKTLNLQLDSKPDLRIDEYINNMIILCLRGIPVKTVEELKQITDIDFYIKLVGIINENLPMQSFFEKVAVIFGAPPLVQSQGEKTSIQVS